MIKKLRTKLITAAMLSLAVVLLAILGIASGVSHHNIVSRVDRTLCILSENGGQFPKLQSEPSTDFDSPELPYESRFFSVRLQEDGTVLMANTGKIAAVDTKTAISYAQEVQASGRTRGFLYRYRYFAVTEQDTQTLVIFLDCGRNLDAWYGFVRTGMGVALAGLLAVFLLLFGLSGRIVHPFAENYEKQKRFITDAGHELKTPLAIIQADSEVLEMDLGENEWLRDIQQQTGRLTELTQDLIFLARMEEGQQPTAWQEISLSELVHQTAEPFRALAKTQQKTFQCEIASGLSMKGDLKALRQLVTILLDNALKYSEVQGTVRLTLERQRNALRLCVCNTTPHIDRSNLPHLFDRFYRTDASRNSQTGGYGLGLSIAAAIVQTHRGKISASTEDEASLCITVSLPG